MASEGMPFLARLLTSSSLIFSKTASNLFRAANLDSEVDMVDGTEKRLTTTRKTIVIDMKSGAMTSIISPFGLKFNTIGFFLREVIHDVQAQALDLRDELVQRIEVTEEAD